jgi:ribosome-binding protein aMBF1 (putative translation factor)
MKLKQDRVVCWDCGGTGKVLKVQGCTLTKARKSAGLTVEALSKRTGLSVSLLYKVENGVRTCTKRVEKAYSNL